LKTEITLSLHSLSLSASLSVSLLSHIHTSLDPDKISGRKAMLLGFFFLVGLRFELRASHLQSRYHLSHNSIPFCSGYFGDGISRNSYLGWSWTTILQISISQVARITSVSHWRGEESAQLVLCNLQIRVFSAYLPSNLRLMVQWFNYIAALLFWTKMLV
jgi:hypothetical protein